MILETEIFARYDFAHQLFMVIGIAIASLILLIFVLSKIFGGIETTDYEFGSAEGQMELCKYDLTALQIIPPPIWDIKLDNDRRT